MIYTEEMRASQARVEATRNIRLSEELPRFTAEEKGELLRQYHPDYHEEGFAVLSVGPNKGDKVPKELAALLQGKSRMDTADVDLDHIQFETDVLVIGGGGAGAAAAIEAARHGAKVLMATKLRIGDANTGMAEGGIQAADKESDSPAAHYLDAIGGGHYKNKPELLAELVLHGPEAIQWLSSLGVLFDKNSDGSMVTTHGGGTSRKRMHACGDYTGAEIMRVLRDEVRNAGVDVVAAAIIRECQERDKGVYALHGPAVWLDTPMVDLINGEGTMEKRLPAMIHMYEKFGINIRKQPILVYPTLHYQNGGICIGAKSETKIPGLYAAGEDVGGIHGTNRLMGNSLLDIIVFGRIAGTEAASYSQTAHPGKGTLDHVRRFDEERAEARVDDDILSPKLLPNYTHNRGTRG